MGIREQVTEFHRAIGAAVETTPRELRENSQKIRGKVTKKDILMENGKDESMTVPCFFTAVEIQHVNLAMRSYRKVIEKMREAAPENSTMKGALESIDNILRELKEQNATFDEIADFGEPS
jgi:predicted HAD superfamily Cof-like phosphohydrolase